MDSSSEKLLAQIIRTTRTAALGTLRDEAPLVSMVAFAPAEDFSAFYIHVNRLAQYAVDMQKDKRVSLLIAETDDGRVDPQAFASISIRGSAVVLQNGEPGYTRIKNLYLERYPDSAPLFALDDFSLWQIKPKGGRFVVNFSKAYNITLEALQKVAER